MNENNRHQRMLACLNELYDKQQLQGISLVCKAHKVSVIPKRMLRPILESPIAPTIDDAINICADLREACRRISVLKKQAEKTANERISEPEAIRVLKRLGYKIYKQQFVEI